MHSYKGHTETEGVDRELRSWSVDITFLFFPHQVSAFTQPMHNLPSVVQSLSHFWLFVTPWTAAHQASLASTISWSLLKGMSVESGGSLCHPFMLAWAGFATLCFCLCAVPCETPTSLMSQAPSLHPQEWGREASPGIPPPLGVLV